MKKRFMMIILVFMAGMMTLGINVLYGDDSTMSAYAVRAPYNKAENDNGVRIDGWRAFRDMTTYGHNNDNGCGYTAMSLLLQYYNDNTRYSGEILPDDF